MTHFEPVLQSIGTTLGQLPQITAVALGGSHASGRADAASDADIYVYTEGPLPADVRRRALDEVALDCREADYWGPSTVGRSLDRSMELDFVFFDTLWLEKHMASVLVHHEARLGYTTAFVQTVHQSRALWDQTGWFARMQGLTNQPYPEALAANILRLNFPVLRDAPHSYREQIALAVTRSDAVSLNHRIAALLSSYFDVLFALNRVYHPGEKRLTAEAEVRCTLLPEGFRTDVAVVAAGGSTVVEHVDRMVDSLGILITSAGVPENAPGLDLPNRFSSTQHSG